MGVAAEQLSSRASRSLAPSVRSTYKQGGLFAGLSVDEQERLVASSRSRTFAAGEFLYVQGDPVRCLYSVSRGVVRTFYTTVDGHEFSIGFWERGDIVGAPDLSGAARRALSAVAQRPTTVLEIGDGDLTQLCVDVPRFAVNLIRALSFKVRWASMAAANLGTKSATSRLKLLLIALGEMSQDRLDDHRVRIEKIYTQANLASMIGCSRQWVNVQMGELRRAGLVLPHRAGERLVVDLVRLRVEV